MNSAVRLDPAKIEAEVHLDGKYVLCTNTALPAAEVAKQDKRLPLVGQFFRATKSPLDRRPFCHQWDATIRGHIVCSFWPWCYSTNTSAEFGPVVGNSPGLTSGRIFCPYQKSNFARMTSGPTCEQPFRDVPVRSFRLWASKVLRPFVPRKIR